MKKLILLLPVLLLFSCSMQKRKYSKGYHIDWTRSSTTPKEKKEPIARVQPVKKQVTKIQEIDIISPPEIQVSSNKSITIATSKQNKTFITRDDPCDVLLFRDGSEIKGKVSEITATEVKYKKCDMLDGPVYIAKKTDMFMIKYANGTREVFKETVSPSTTTVQKKYVGNTKTHPLAIASLVCGILCITLYFAIIFGILAIVFGNSAIRKIQAQPEMYTGEGLAKAGKILGIVFLALIALVILIFILAVALI